MELHSPIYLLFLLPAVFVAAFTRRPAGRLLLFLALSYCFYLSWSTVFILLLAGSSLVNFLMGRLLYRNRHPWVLFFGIAANILILLLARHAGDFLSGWFEPPSVPGVLVPVGVSFYTFQALGSLIDIYRGFDRKPTLLEFLVFMAFWPVVLSGPICRLPEMLPQFREPLSARKHAPEGIQRIVLGLFMKVVLADSLAHGVFNQGGVNQGFDQVQNWSPLDIVSLSLGYGLQLFFDFAGYSHIAIGSALLVGIRLRENFRSPFGATSPSDFWGRWHMSLSSWIRDYVFFPLATRRRSLGWRLLAVVVAMVVFGAWHGLTATFLLWGLYHGLVLAGQRMLSKNSPNSIRSAPALGWALTFVVINLGWILFRSGSLDQAGRMYAGLFSIGQPASLAAAFHLLVMVLFCGHLVLLFSTSQATNWIESERVRQIRRLASPAFFTAMFLMTLAWGEGESPFVYVQF